MTALDQDLAALYQETILDHSRRPRNYGPLPEANRRARGDNPLCGDRVTLHLALGAAGRIEAVAFEGKGCAICLSSASLLTEAVQDRTAAEALAYVEELRRLCTEDGHEPPEALAALKVLSGVRQYPVRVKCATLPWHTLRAALNGENEATTE